MAEPRESERTEWRAAVRRHAEAAGCPLPDAVVDELALHLEDVEAAALAFGASVAEARSRAQELLRQSELPRLRRQARHDPRRSWAVRAELESRAHRGPGGLSVLHSFRIAVRQLRQHPHVALTAIVILGLGIGAATTIFSVVDTVLLRALPYPDADRLMVFTEGSHSGPDLEDWRRSLDSFDRIEGVWDSDFDLTGDGTPEQIAGARVSDGFFSLFGGRPQIGRLPSAEEHREGAAVAVLGDGFWRRRFGGDSAVLGRSLRLEGKPVTVVGVLAADLEPPEGIMPARIDVWLPLDLAQTQLQSRQIHVLQIAGRLAPGATPERAQAELDALREAQAVEFPEAYVHRDGSIASVPLEPLRELTVSGVRDRLQILLGAVGLLLLIACGDVAILLLARGTARRREMALRGALGASRRRLAGQLLCESALLGLGGGVLGAVLAFLGTEAFVRFQPGNLPRVEQLGVDLRVLAFAAAVSLLTALVFGLLPALQAARVQGSEMLKEGGSTGSAGPRRERVRGALVVAEVAVALTLLVGAGLLFRSLMARLQVDPGFETGGLLTLALTPGTWDEDSTYTAAERVRLSEDLRREIAALPGVRAVGGGWVLPFVRTGGNRCCWRTEVRSQVMSADDEALATMVHPVTPGFYEALEAPIVRGRPIREGDGNLEPTPAVVDTATARTLFGDRDPLGQPLRMGRGDGATELQVVGIVQDLRLWGLDQEVGATVFVPYARFGGEADMLYLAVRTEVAPASLAPALRELVARLDPDLPVDEIATMEERVSRSLAEPRFLSLLLGGFAGVALLLAAGGIYASMAYWVSQRRRELGIRVAVGAGNGEVMGLVIRRGLALTAAGLVVGAAASLALARALESVVWGVTPRDPLSLATAAAVLAAASLAACAVPARRATRVDPVAALRSE